MTLLEYANDRENVVAWYTSTALPTGEEVPVGHPDFPAADAFDDLEGEVDGDGRWTWGGTGRPTDWCGNSILRVTAYVDPTLWTELTTWDE